MPFSSQTGLQRLSIFLAAVVFCIVSSAALAAGPVTTWTRIALGDGASSFSPHTATLMHLSMHDALNAIDPRFARWADASRDRSDDGGDAVLGAKADGADRARADRRRDDGRGANAGGTTEGGANASGANAGGGDARATASPEAALAAAAHAVLVAREPQRRASFDAALADALAAVPPGGPRDAGVAAGRAAAGGVLAKYEAAGVRPGEFAASDEPGRWRPTPPASVDVAPFVPFEAFAGDAVQSIAVPPPPPPGSAEYRFGVAKVRLLGARNAVERSADETAAALFWARQSPIRNFLALALRTLEARGEGTDPWAGARAMALVSMALSDAFTVAARAKARFRYWRPITAIREGGFGIDADPYWVPLVPTPQHPEYPSAHAAECAAGATIAALLFGSPGGPVRFVATDVDGRPSRRFDDYADIAAECATSREWAGAHFGASNAAGLALGETVARRVADTQLAPARRRASAAASAAAPDPERDRASQPQD
ncbi:MAG: vanadium-dependent haloperoxidase [Lautropia sp.]